MSEEIYSANDISQPEQRVHVQKRIGFYLGDNPLDTALRELIDNSMDEFRSGYGETVEITLRADGSIEVSDNGRGIPTDINDRSGVNGLIMALGRIGSGGKFSSQKYTGGDSAGLNGIGASATVATASRVIATVYAKGKKSIMQFQNGIPGQFTTPKGAEPTPEDPFKATDDLVVLKDDRSSAEKKSRPTGTTIRYWSNLMFFDAHDKLHVDNILQLLNYTSFLVPTTTIIVNDWRDPENEETKVFKNQSGLAGLVEMISPDQPVAEAVHVKTEGFFTELIKELDENQQLRTVEGKRRIGMDIVLQWGTGYEAKRAAFVNTVYTPLGGRHVKGVENALLKVFGEKVSSTRGLVKPKETPPILDDVLEGLTYAFAMEQPEPPFLGQDKQKLGGGVIITNTVEGALTKVLTSWVNNKKNAEALKVILQKIANASSNRQSQRAQKDLARRKTALSSSAMPAKLLDCAEPNTEYAELIICEGDSALGTLKSARESRYQALLPIRGKILNTHKSTLTESLKNVEIASIVQVIGAGVGKDFDSDKMRVGKIIIAADADVDGAHIAVLLTTMFYNLMPQVIREGRLYAAAPPLFAIRTGLKPEDMYYAENEVELEYVLNDLAKKKIKVHDVKRLKGLGEMESEDFWTTTLNPESRTLRRITMESAEKAQEMVDLTMGPLVPPRREWIMNNRALLADEDIDA